MDGRRPLASLLAANELFGLRVTLVVYALAATLVAAWVALVPWLRDADPPLAADPASL